MGFYRQRGKVNPLAAAQQARNAKGISRATVAPLSFGLGGIPVGLYAALIGAISCSSWWGEPPTSCQAGIGYAGLAITTIAAVGALVATLIAGYRRGVRKASQRKPAERNDDDVWPAGPADPA